MDNRIHFAYPRGRMELVLTTFFPCTIREARIIFPLINDYAETSEKEKLREYLTQYAYEKQEAMKKMEAGYLMGRRIPGSNYRHTQVLYKRALRNIDFLED